MVWLCILVDYLDIICLFVLNLVDNKFLIFLIFLVFILLCLKVWFIKLLIDLEILEFNLLDFFLNIVLIKFLIVCLECCLVLVLFKSLFILIVVEVDLI